jgi:oligopeptide/dipeptide ABC transporter ATP-binding protein
VLQVRDLTIRYHSGEGPPHVAVDDLSLHIGPAEAMGLIGESGSGKSTLALSILGLLPPQAGISSGSIRFQRREILDSSEEQLAKIRGAGISLIFQDPSIALNPVIRVRDQVREVVRAHGNMSRAIGLRQAEDALAEAGLQDTRTWSGYPHQLSAGQRQRVVIAQALVRRPTLLIADEPTSALDNVTQDDILRLLRNLRSRYQLSLLFITQDPLLLTGLVDRVAVMHAGQIVEMGGLKQILRQPRHPYTEALLRSVPCLPTHPSRAARIRRPLPTLPAETVRPFSRGCQFASRCSSCLEVCGQERPSLVPCENGGFVRCLRYESQQYN